MLNNRLLCRTARNSSRSGFTLVELLVVIGIIAILAGVALGPITNGIKQAKHNASMQQARQIGSVCYSYSTDNTQNGNSYPCGATSEAIANTLISGSYVNDPSVFCVSGALGGEQAFSGTPIVLLKANITYNFTVMDKTKPSTGGITPTTSDLIPVVYFDGGTITGAYPFVPGTAATLALSATKSPFGTDGVAVFYKGNNAAYLKAGTTTAGTVDNFISANCTDVVTYQEVVP
jgi:prepilin-type N-terminal cleavage/methylation domain-containing protein